MLPGREADNWIHGRGTEPEYIFIVHLVFLTSVRS